MQRNQSFTVALAALIAGSIISRAGTKLSLVKGKSPEPLGPTDLLDGMPASMYDVDPNVPVRVLPQIRQDRNSIVGPWAPLPMDLLASDWNIHTEDPAPAPAPVPAQDPAPAPAPVPAQDPAPAPVPAQDPTDTSVDDTDS